MAAVLVDPAFDSEPFDIAAGWQRWKAGDGQAIDALVSHYAAWVRGVARSVFLRVRGRGDDWSDYVQNATVGMLEAMRAFDPERGIPFERFAHARVRGAVFNGLRALRLLSAGVHARQTEDGTDDLLDQPFDDPVERLLAIVAGLATGHALAIHAEWAMQATHETPYEAALRSQLGERLSALMRRLTHNERSVVELHYVQHLPFVQIADVLGVTKGRVSQLHRQAMERLRERMMHDRWQISL